jgi:methylated-DNA-[protein]-cysteine S-methyltransferase
MDTHCEWVQQSPFGPLLVETGPKGVRAVTFRANARRKSDVCKECRTIERAFERYFSGEAEALVEVKVDLSGARTEFNRRVLQKLHDSVSPGETTSYAALAAAAGRPGAARAVGSAMANNPVPIVVPCHRVLASNGGLGGYGGGLSMKRRLLQLEGIRASAEDHANGKPRSRSKRGPST